MREQLASAREVTSGPIAVNLLLPFLRQTHAQVTRDADVVVTFWGRPERLSAKPWIHQVGSVDEAAQAHAAGADAVIVQGIEAGGHVRGRTAAMRLLEQVRSRLPAGYPLMLAGGIADADDVAAALASGADAAVCGTRFLMSDESGASAGYKARLRQGDGTILTELFGLGWPGSHRVLLNGATARWLRNDPRGPAAARMLNRATRSMMTRGPERMQSWLVRHQSTRIPIFSPIPPSAGMPDRVLETSPLYAGETVARIHEILPAGDIVHDLVATPER
jgi:NAD(P)H-dependent flavin oxidoreductase YrpB (nitropropane dioxygenase family)